MEKADGAHELARTRASCAWACHLCPCGHGPALVKPLSSNEPVLGGADVPALTVWVLLGRTMADRTQGRALSLMSNTHLTEEGIFRALGHFLVDRSALMDSNDLVWFWTSFSEPRRTAPPTPSSTPIAAGVGAGFQRRWCRLGTGPGLAA